MNTGECIFTSYYESKLQFPYNDDSILKLLKETRSFAKFLNVSFKPKSVIEFGCGSGLLISELIKLKISSVGLESNRYLASKANNSVKKYIKIVDPEFKNVSLNKKVDLAIALNVVDNFNDEFCDAFLKLLCSASDNIIFSFCSDVNSIHCFNVKQAEYWVAKFAENGFVRDLDFRPMFDLEEDIKANLDLSSQSYNIFRFKKQSFNEKTIIKDYERNIRLLSNQYYHNLSVMDYDKLQCLTREQEEDLNRLKEKLKKLEDEKDKTNCELKKNKNEIKALLADREDLKYKLQQKNHEIKSMKKSFWWKLGRPFRDSSNNKSNKNLSNHNNKIKGFEELNYTGKIKNEVDKLFLGESLAIDNFISERLAIEQAKTKFSANVKFSILVPLYNTKKLFLRQMIDSVINQTYRNWELCLADASDLQHDYVEQICKDYSKRFKNIKYKKLIKNKGISENTNEAVKLATGNFISLLDHDDILHPSALFETAKAIIEEKADFTYTDETKFESDPRITFESHLKPDFSIDNLRSNNYICHFSSFSKKLFDEVGYFNSQFDGSQDHDLMLRLSERAQKIVHIPYVLYYWRCHKGSVASDIGAKNYAIDAGIQAVSEHLKRLNLNAQVSNIPKFGAIYSVKYAVKGKPSASIIISSLGNTKSLKRCITSINRLTEYKNYKIIAIVKDIIPKSQLIFRDDVCKYVNLDLAGVEKNFDKKKQKKFEAEMPIAEQEVAYQNAEIYKEIEQIDNVELIHWDKPFNYSAMNNYGAELSKEKYCVFLSDNSTVANGYWLESMLGFLSRDDVSVVGAKILYPFGKIKSTGLTFSRNDVIRNLHEHLPDESPGYFGRAVYPNDCSAVSHVCMAVKRDEFLEINGFSKTLPVLFADADLCLRFRKDNKLIVYDPFAKVYYHDFITDKFNKLDDANITEQEQKNLFTERWRNVLDKFDPYYNQNFVAEGPTFLENTAIKYGKEKT